MNVPEGALIIFRDSVTRALRVGVSPHQQYWTTGGMLTIQTETVTLFSASIVRVI